MIIRLHACIMTSQDLKLLCPDKVTRQDWKLFLEFKKGSKIR